MAKQVAKKAGKKRVKKKLRRKYCARPVSRIRARKRADRNAFTSAGLMIIFLTDTRVLFHILTRKRAGNIKTDMLNVSGNSA